MLMAFEYGKPWWKLVHRNMDALEDEIVWHGICYWTIELTIE